MQLDWEIWLDSNLSPVLAKWMASKVSMKVKSAYSLSLHSLTDLEVYSKAKNEGKIIIVSKDADFTELINRLGSPPKLISIKTGNCSNQILWRNIQTPIIEAISILTTSEIGIVEID